MTGLDPQGTGALAPANAPGRPEMPVEGRAGASTGSGSNGAISWGARSDVGLVRGHNEDSFLLRAPLFVVSDGMGGHAAGEVASSIAVETIGERAPATADDVLLGAAVEAANQAVIRGAEEGVGKPGMGCTASAVVFEKNQMSVAHVGDSRVYLLRRGTLVRVTHDHSYVEELVDLGQITPDEARVHPSRSIITRALGSDPDMYADHFTLEVQDGDRIIICSDGLSSMIADSELEGVAVSSATPQQAADNLVASALTAGGSDNVTVIVIDVLDDGTAAIARRKLLRRLVNIVAVLLVVVALAAGSAYLFLRSEWFLGVDGDYVAIYQGVNAELFGLPLYELDKTSTVKVEDLSESVQSQLEDGIRAADRDEAIEIIDDYRAQIDEAKERAAEVASEATATDSSGDDQSDDEGDGTGSEDEADAESAADDASDEATSADDQADDGTGAADDATTGAAEGGE